MKQSVAAPTAFGPRRVAAGAPAPLGIAGRTRPGVIGVAVAHGDPLVRAAFREALDDAAGIAVVGEAATADEAVALATHLRPDVVVVDVRLPGTGCVDATRRTRAACRTAVMLLSGDEPDPRLLDALRAGAGGVMRTDSAPSDLIRALTLLGRGRPLRPRRRRHGRHTPEDTMQLPNVIEIRRGSAHAMTVAPAAAAVASSHGHIRRPRWNSGT